MDRVNESSEMNFFGLFYVIILKIVLINKHLMKFIIL